MPLTITATRSTGYNQPERQGQQFAHTLDWLLAGTYNTNGHTYSAADLGGINPAAVNEIEFPTGLFRSGVNAVAAVWDKANRRVMFYWTGPAVAGVLAEVANNTSLAGFTGKVRVRTPFG